MSVGKTYAGDRTIDGIVVTVDGKDLDPREDEKLYSRNGFEWGYAGASPSQLAFAILREHFGNSASAVQHQERFMRDIVANFENEWELTSDDIAAVLQRDA